MNIRLKILRFFAVQMRIDFEIKTGFGDNGLITGEFDDKLCPRDITYLVDTVIVESRVRESRI